MSYTPTAEDLAYILASDGERFSEQERRMLGGEIDKAFQRRSDNGASGLEGTIMSTWANRWVELGGNGGQALTASLIPPEPGDDVVLDPDFAAICVECQSNEPCCLISGSVSDSTDSTRKITWPPVMDESDEQDIAATTLLVVAKEVEGRHLCSKVQVEWEGQRCQVGHYDRPRMETMGLTDGRSRIEEKQVEVATGYEQMLNVSLALRNYVPENVLYALFAMDAVLAIASAVKGRQGASFMPYQCISDVSMGAQCRVIPLPYAKLDGKLELATRISFTTAGVSASAEAKGTLTGQYGADELTAEGSAGGSANTGQAIDSGKEAPGLVGTMASIIERMDHYVSVGNRQRQELDRTQYASGIQLSKSLTFEPKGFELTAVTGSPDLLLAISSLESTLSIGVSGKLDFIDALAYGFSGPGARAIQEARARMAAGEHVKAKLQADLEVAATGSLRHTIDSGASITIPANGNLEAAYAGIQQQFGGELKINGTAEIAIQVSTEVWVFSAKAGASGSLHTAWIWAMRMHEGERQRRYEFEGVVLTLTGYAEVQWENNDNNDNVRQTGFNVGGERSAEMQAGDLFEQVGRHIASSQTAAERMAQERPDAPASGRDYPIWSPEVIEWQAY
ncbi:hypothetical protein [Billgrantia antri]|uniref:Uncharacterized protein n=1 Tax=Billgrantia antri TaxID=2846777 RepID=A0ABS6ZUS7_9GAMM|nr:hypothetical protein [Halomonas antri]MBW6392810.1 hypothetical protein [Halomonas antri]